MKKNLKVLALAGLATLVLSACGDVNAPVKPAETSKQEVAADASEKTEGSTEEVDAHGGFAKLKEQFPEAIDHEGTPVDGATLKVAIVSDSPIKGIFNGWFYSNATDADFMRFTMNGAFPIDGDYKFILDSDETPINVHVDVDAKTVSYKINPKFKWSNGDQVTTADIVKTYEIAAHPDFISSSKSVRFDEAVRKIVGIVDYNEGRADTISGLEVIDDSNMIIHLEEIGPAALWGANFAPEFVNAKQFEDVPMDKIIEHPALRENPLSYGPYVIDNVVPGEKVTFKANEHYYQGVPKVKYLEIEVVPTSQQIAALKAGKYDLAYNVTNDVFDEVSALSNVSLVGKVELYMSYIGFKLGTWDSEKSMVVTNPEAKMADVNLRKAMAQAVDFDALGEQFYSGLRFTAPSPLGPTFASLHDPNVKAYPYDMEAAKALLDEAGYKDVDGDGIREDKNGQPFEITFAMMSGSEVQEPISQYFMQQWKTLGLKTSLLDGRLLDLNDFYDRVQADDPAIDMYIAAWGLGSDPDQNGLYAKTSQFNFPRYTSEGLEKTLNAMQSKEALNDDFRIKNYHEFERVFMDELPVIPMHNKMNLLPVNKRVKHYDFSDSNTTGWGWHEIELTADTPIAE